MPNTILKIIRIRTLSNTICCTKDIILLKTFIFSNGLFFEKNLIFEKRDLEISTDPSMKQEKNKQTVKA